MRRLLASIDAEMGSIDPDAARDALTAAVDEIKRCVLDPSRAPDLACFAHLDRLSDGAVTQKRARVSLPPEPRPPRQPTIGVAADMMALLAGGGNDDLHAVLANIDDAPDVDAPADDLGTLREPVGGGAKSASARVLMKGELQPGIVPDLIQLFTQNKETGKLVIEGTERSAVVFFSGGAIVDASSGEDVGERGFYHAMTIQKGRFSYQRGVEAEAIRIQRKTQLLMMDTLRLIDEAHE